MKAIKFLFIITSCLLFICFLLFAVSIVLESFKSTPSKDGHISHIKLKKIGDKISNAVMPVFLIAFCVELILLTILIVARRLQNSR